MRALLPLLLAAAALAACTTPSALGLRTDGRLPAHGGQLEAGFGFAALDDLDDSNTVEVTGPSLAVHLDNVSLAANVHYVPDLVVEERSFTEGLVVSGEARVRVYENGPEGAGVALLFGAGLPPTGFGVDAGFVASTPRANGLRGYGGFRFNPVFGEEISNHFFATVAAGLSWTGPGGLVGTAELMRLGTLVTGEDAPDVKPFWGLALSAGWVFGTPRK